MKKAIELRPREIEVANWVAAGYATKQIANLWCIEECTIKKHRENIMAATETENLIAAIVVLHQHGIINLNNIKVLRTTTE